MHRGLTALLAAAGLVLAGCGTPASGSPESPEITFYAHGETIRVDAAQFCNAIGTECSPPNPDAIGDLRVPPGSPVQISVPSEVSSAPWQVAMMYRLPNGQEVADRSSVFTPDERRTYTARPPTDDAQFTRVEVQQYSGVLLPAEDGGIQFALAGTWVVTSQP